MSESHYVPVSSTTSSVVPNSQGDWTQWNWDTGLHSIPVSQSSRVPAPCIALYTLNPGTWHKMSGTRRDWGTMGMGHNGTGTQRDWDTVGLLPQR